MNKIYQKHTLNKKISVKRNLVLFVTELRTSFALPVRSGRCESRTRAGFTLIELLVVVLIVGILAAIALPKYQQAVEKARFMQLLTVLRAIEQAQDVYIAANGSYSPDLEGLDVSVPDKLVGKARILIRENGAVIYSDLQTHADMGLAYVSYQNKKGNCARQCRAYFEDKIEQNICRELTSKSVYDSTVNGGLTYVYCFDQ